MTAPKGLAQISEPARSKSADKRNVKLRAPLTARRAAPESSRKIFGDTEAQLTALGYAVAWQHDGNCAIIIGDYPQRPIVDNFRMVWVSQPVGHAQPARTESPAHYSFQPPRASGLGLLEGVDIRTQLIRLSAYVEAYARRHALECDPATLAPLLHLLGDDPTRIRQCVSLGIHPKWLADLLAFELTYDEALGLKGVPYETLYDLYAR